MLSSLAALIHRRPRRTGLIVLAFVLIAGVIGGPIAGQLQSSASNAPTHSQSQQATKKLEAAAGVQPAPGIILLVSTPNGPNADASRINSITQQLRHVPGIAEAQGPAGVSDNHRQVLVTGTLRAGASDGDVAKAVEQRFANTPSVTVGGSAVIGDQIGSTVSKDLGFSELIVMPLLIVLSLLFFRGRAALMPVAAGVVTVLGTFLVLAGINKFYGLSVYALNLVIGLGLGLSVDYTLFILTRYRDELNAGQNTREALVTAMTDAGRTVLFSAVTVAAALATLTVFPLTFAISMGLAGAVTALVAAVAALIVSPALITLWGTKLARPNAERSAARWTQLSRAVTRRPGLIAAATAAVMVVIASSSVGTHWTPIGSQVVPKGDSARTVADTLGREFPQASAGPIVIAAQAPASATATIDRLNMTVALVSGIIATTSPRYLGADTWELTAQPAGDPTGAGAQHAVQAIRDITTHIPICVGGQAAAFVDQQAAIASRLPLAIGLLALATFLVLWLMTDSVVLPLKALVMNALTVGAALAPLTFIYGHGRLSGLLGYTSNGGVEPTDFLVTAALVFALSTDYGVILLGRITEARRQGIPTRDAVSVGIGRTGPVLSAAAILLAVAIGAFATSHISFIQQIGIATAFGVLLDAFIVRSLLVPSLMALLGEANWWSPRPMRLIHQRLQRAHTQPSPQR